MRSAAPLGRIDVMSRKDYRLIAAALREERPEAAEVRRRTGCLPKYWTAPLTGVPW
jgi:hypothetical protein